MFAARINHAARPGLKTPQRKGWPQHGGCTPRSKVYSCQEGGVPQVPPQRKGCYDGRSRQQARSRRGPYFTPGPPGSSLGPRSPG